MNPQTLQNIEQIKANQLELQAEQKHQQEFRVHMAELQATREGVFTAIRELIRYLDSSVQKTAVVNIPDSIKTPDVAQVSQGIAELSSLIANKDVDLTPVVEALGSLAEKLDQLPKEIIIPEQKETVIDFKPIVEKLDQLEKSFDITIPETKVEVKPTPVNVEAPVVNVEQDFTTLKKDLKAIVDAVKKIKIPEVPKTDTTKIEKALEKQSEQLDKLYDKPGPTFQTDLPFQDNDGNIKRVTLVGGAVPITGSIEATADPKVDSIVDVQTDYIYSGEALPGTLSSVAEWRISRTTKATLETRWADGVATFTKEWDNRTGYNY